MKKLSVALFHIRALPACLVCLAAGILFVSIDVWWISAICFALCAAGLVVAVILAPKRKAVVGACLVALALSLFTAVWADSILQEATPIEGEVSVQGRVCEVQTDSDGTVLSVVLDSLVVDGDAHKGKMQLSMPDGTWLFAEDVDGYVVGVAITVGDYVQASGTATTVVFSYYDSYSVHCSLQKRYYTLSTHSLQQTYLPPSRTAGERVRLELYRVLRRNMGTSAGFAYAFLTGNTCYVAPALLADFRWTGTAHLLAVSGLHVGVLAGVLLWILKKCRCPAIVKPLVSAAVLGVYTWLCAATPSVLRASILAVVATTASALGRRKDPPSILAFTALGILVVQPLYLFDVSFLLSFSAYAGIVLLYPPFRTLLARLHPKVGDALALGMSVSVSIFPMSTYFFGGVSLLTLPLNLVLVPLMSVVYVVLAVGTLLAIVKPLGFVLVGVSGVCKGLFYVERLLGDIGYVPTHTAVWMLPIFYGGVAVASDYCLAPKSVKYPIAATLTTVVVLLAFLL